MSKERFRGSESSEQEVANSFLTLEDVLRLTRDQGVSDNMAYVQEKLALALVGQAEKISEVKQVVTRIISNLSIMVDALGRDELTDRQVMTRLSNLADLAANSTLGLHENSGNRPVRQVFEDDPGLDFRHYPESDDEEGRQDG